MCGRGRRPRPLQGLPDRYNVVDVRYVHVSMSTLAYNVPGRYAMSVYNSPTPSVVRGADSIDLTVI